MREYVEGVLNRASLREIFHREGVESRAYSLEGSHEPECYVLSSRPGGWAVFYSERGHEQGRVEFDTEDEACHYLLNLVFEDPTTRAR